jgi:hypothetical protein
MTHTTNKVKESFCLGISRKEKREKKGAEIYN